MEEETAKKCPRCGLLSYPRIAPAIIVGVRKADRILLVRAHRHRSGLYSNVAGFVEPGETLEEAVRRELDEEVGLRVRGIRYFGSQPWPFPHSLMVGFTAVHAGGSIRIYEKEIADAGWFSPDELPRIPDPYTIARRLIDAVVREISTGLRQVGPPEAAQEQAQE
jgi:NAD+ diphosphatase